MKTFRVGIMLELMWPYRRHLDVFAGTQRFANEAKDWVCELDQFFPEDEKNPSRRLSRYDGIIARASSELAECAQRAQVPLVNVWFNSPVADTLPGVFGDLSAVGQLAGRHLADRGFRSFGCLSTVQERGHQEMISGFHETIKERGHQCLCARTPRTYYRTGKHWTRFQRILDEWIASWTPPIALFAAYNDITSRHIVNACERHGLKFPNDVALITSTNEPTIGEYPPPSLTSVEIKYEQIGYHAAEMLDQLMRGTRPAQKHLVLSPTGVIGRDSTDFFAVEDDCVALAMRFIEGNVGQKISVDDVVEAAGISRRTLERRFRACSGRSIAAEIRRLRILKAKRLLSETDMLVKQISREVGFRDPIRLHEVFLREENITPSDFRKLSRG